MDPALVGVLLTVAFGIFAGAFAWLRSDIRDLATKNHADISDLATKNHADISALATENRSDIRDLRAENQADHRETNARIGRLEGKVDSLIMALARAGFLVDPQAPEPPSAGSEG